MTRVLCKTKSDYNHISVVEDRSIRKLLFGDLGTLAHEQSAIDVSDLREHVFDYSLLSMYSLLFINAPSRVLVVGLGGGVVAREISHFVPEASVEVIEIDRAVIDVAKKYFYFPDNILIHNSDAYVVVNEMRNNNEKYDMVIIDAYSSTYVPYPLMSNEFFQNVFSIASDNGVVVSNICNWHPSYYSYVNTCRSVFGDVIYELRGDRNENTSLLYVPKGGCKLSQYEGFPYPIRYPEVIELSDDIKKSKIFSMPS